MLLDSEPELNKLFRLARKIGAWDFYLRAGSPPLMRIPGITKPTSLPALSRQDLDRLLAALLFAEQQRRLERREDLTFTCGCEEESMFRVTVSTKSGHLMVSAHRI